MTADALIGSTGFVGSVLGASHKFEGQFHSRNIGELPKREWRHVVCAGMPAEKWRANQDPAGDRQALERLWSSLDIVRARQVTLISTIDVFEYPWDCDEGDAADAEHAYGRHRAELERRVLDRFADSAVVRLPALYGPGLKKNVLYDLLKGRPSPVPRRARFQWYDIERLPADLETVAAHRLQLVQLVSEPVSIGDLVDRCFPGAQIGSPDRPPPRYDLRSRHAATFGGSGGYLEDRETSLGGVERFVRRVRQGEVTCASPSP